MFAVVARAFGDQSALGTYEVPLDFSVLIAPIPGRGNQSRLSVTEPTLGFSPNRAVSNTSYQDNEETRKQPVDTKLDSRIPVRGQNPGLSAEECPRIVDWFRLKGPRNLYKVRI